MATQVTGDQYYALDGQLTEIKRQLRQPGGYPFNPEQLKEHLQAAIEGRFMGASLARSRTPYLLISGPIKNHLIANAMMRGREIGEWAKDVMSKPQFITTNGVTYHLVVIFGEEFAADEERTFANVNALAKIRHYGIPPAEIVLLLAQFTQRELGRDRLVVMHDPISDSDGDPRVLGVSRPDYGHGWLRTWIARPARKFRREDAFVYLAPEEVVAVE